MTEQPRPVDSKAVEGCLVFVVSLVPATGICLVLMGVIKHFIVDSWLIALGVGLISAFPTLGFAYKWVLSRVRKGEKKLEAQRRREQGIIEGERHDKA